MNPPERLDPQLLEMLSAYLDGRLEGAEKAALEARLNNEENLRRQLAELRFVRDSLRTLPLLKPPRSLALTPALAGMTAGKLAVFSPRRLALGSALASLAFVCVLSINLLSSSVFLPAASAPRVSSANESLAGPRQSVDNGSEKYATTEQASGPEATAAPAQAAMPSPTLAVVEATGCGDCHPIETPTIEPSPTITFNYPGCGCHPTEVQAAILAATAAVPPSRGSQPSIRVDFQTAAPFLEAFFGLGAVLLAALSLIFRRRH